jgi:hypothetical protein
MVESLLYHACRSNTQLLTDRVAAWSNGGAPTATPQDAADALTLVLSWPAQVRQLAESLWKEAAAGKAGPLQETGESFLKLVDEQLTAVEKLQRVVEEQVRQGARLRRAADLGTVLAELRTVRERFAADWPWINEDIVAESRQEYDRGDFQTVAEILDELQGKNP